MFRAVLALGPVIGCDFKSTEIDLTPSAWSKHLDLYKHRALPTKQFPPHPHPTPPPMFTGYSGLLSDLVLYVFHRKDVYLMCVQVLVKF